MLVRYWKEILIVVLVVVIILSIRSCVSNKKSYMNEKNRTDSFKVITDKQGKKIAMQDAYIVKRHKDVEKHIIKIEGLKKINTQLKVKVTNKIDSISIPIEKPIYINCDSTDNKYLKVPAWFSVSDKWYDVSGEITDIGTVLFDSLETKSEPTFTIGYKKKGFLKKLFKKPELVTTYTDKSPYVTVTDMSNVIVDNTKRRNISLGIQGGIGATKGGLSPYIGIGLQYNLINF